MSAIWPVFFTLLQASLAARVNEDKISHVQGDQCANFLQLEVNSGSRSFVFFYKHWQDQKLIRSRTGDCEELVVAKCHEEKVASKGCEISQAERPQKNLLERLRSGGLTSIFHTLGRNMETFTVPPEGINIVLPIDSPSNECTLHIWEGSVELRILPPGQVTFVEEMDVIAVASKVKQLFQEWNPEADVFCTVVQDYVVPGQLYSMLLTWALRASIRAKLQSTDDAIFYRLYALAFSRRISQGAKSALGHATDQILVGNLNQLNDVITQTVGQVLAFAAGSMSTNVEESLAMATVRDVWSILKAVEESKTGHLTQSLWHADRVRVAADFIAFYQGLQLNSAQQAGNLHLPGLPNIAFSNLPRAVLFTCAYGGGHKSAAQAVAGYLHNKFEVSVVDTTNDDNFQSVETQVGSYFFNEVVLKRQLYSLHNFADKWNKGRGGTLVEYCPTPDCDNHRKANFRRELLRSRPELVITVYHMDLMHVLEAAHDLGDLPVLHLATDMDIKMPEIFSSPLLYPRFRAGIPFDVPQSWKSIAPLKKEQMFLSGYPVRKSFVGSITDPAELERQHQEAKKRFVAAGVKMLLIMSGGGGQDVAWPYLLAARGIGQPLHIVIVAGGNNAIIDNVRATCNNTHPDFELEPEQVTREIHVCADPTVTIEVAKDPANTREDKPFFVQEKWLSVLMDAADVMLTKPGGGSTAEVAYRGVPAIFDASIELLHWEKFTVDVFVEEGRGVVFNDLPGLRAALLAAPKLGRSTRLAEDGHGQILDPSKAVAKAAEELMSTSCEECELFASSKFPWA
mmetsp:Transcript_87093/g.154098  ORF Transcript_87093/g.154098 Transcript_87093/m.154098 type:complete len:796 (+) Transcript_87093:61-2448(+)